MRLLHSENYELKEFFGKKIPRYAILSHRWEDDEVSFQDMENGDYKSKAGFNKIKGTCNRAKKAGYEWVWIDTCCIDKTSSAELSEAINSMFAWYERSGICYAYLSDVPTGQMFQKHWEKESAVRKSLWFTRGWTLQELLAPREIQFIDQEWNTIAHKSDAFWMGLLSEITGIRSFYRFRTASVAQKMSWLSRRETTRVEDMAYCMLGIFGVFMPPLYGEEMHAFHRLQLEILKVSDDRSIFAWKSLLDGHETPSDRGLLARHPCEFQESGSIIGFIYGENKPYTMTNKGLAINLSGEALNYVFDKSNSNRKRPVMYEVSLGCAVEYAREEQIVRTLDVKEVKIYLFQYQHDEPMTRIFSNHFARIFRRPSFSDSPDIAELDIDPNGALIYVPEPDPLQTVYAKRYYMEIDIMGLNLQDRLRKILVSDLEEDLWVEPNPLEFKMDMQCGDSVELIFKLRPTTTISNDCISVTFRTPPRSPEINVEIKFVENNDLPEFMRTVSSLKRGETLIPSDDDGPRTPVDRVIDIAVSRPAPGVPHFKIWCLDDTECHDTLKDCKYVGKPIPNEWDSD